MEMHRLRKRDLRFSQHYIWRLNGSRQHSNENPLPSACPPTCCRSFSHCSSVTPGTGESPTQSSLSFSSPCTLSAHHSNRHSGLMALRSSPLNRNCSADRSCCNRRTHTSEHKCNALNPCRQAQEGGGNGVLPQALHCTVQWALRRSTSLLNVSSADRFYSSHQTDYV
jgi:hypothetical protein